MWFKRLTAWFQKFNQMVKYHQIVNEAKELSVHQPNRKLCETLFTELRPIQFNNYSPSTGVVVVIAPLYTDIDTYTLKMKEFARLIKQGRSIPSDWNDTAAVEMSIDRFFTTKDGYYSNVVQSVSAFKDAGLQLCLLLTPADTETVGVYEHNLRILTKLFINMRHTTTTLINVSLTKNA